MADLPALFEPRDDGLFQPSELTRTGWNPHDQHGSPPAGLMTWAIEQLDTLTPMLATRLTFDLLRPIPLTPLRVTAETVRTGKRVQIDEAKLFSEETMVAIGRVLRIRRGEVEVAGPGPLEFEVPAPDEVPVQDLGIWSMPGDSLSRYHLDAVEIRSVAGSFGQPGPGVSWFKLNCTLLPDEPLSPLVRTTLVADLANGNSHTLDPNDWIYINPDLAIHLHRYPRGEWIGMRSTAYQHRTGIGMTDTLAFDTTGAFGAILQSQLIKPVR